MYKKKLDKRYLLIIIIVVSAFALVILTVSLKDDRDLNPVEKVIKDAGTFTVKVVSYPFDFLKNMMKENSEKDRIYKKYKDKDKESDSIDSIISSNDNLENEVAKLKEVLELNTVLSDKVLVNATVVYRNLSYFYDEITIDKGSSDGIEKDMAVITSKGLIGKTSKVSNNTSTVKLLSNENMNNKISVKVKTADDYVYGLIYKYNAKSNTYMIEGISQNVNIEEGADVVTTGMGNVFPSGLLVGKVKGMTTDNFDLSKVLEVSSSVNFNDIDYVSVVKRNK